MSRQVPARAELHLAQRFALLPRGTRAAVATWLALAFLPGAFLALARLSAAPAALWMLAHPVALHLFALMACLGVLLLLEPPRSWHPTLYLAQLLDRLQVLQAEYDAALRRRLTAAESGSPTAESPP